jgi:toxin ParE1/3/4
MRLELSRQAQSDLDDIRDYSVERFGPDRAATYLDAVEQAFRRILDQPEIGEARPGLGSRLRSLPCGSHRVYYDVRDDRAVVRRILHKSMDVERHL